MIVVVNGLWKISDIEEILGVRAILDGENEHVYKSLRMTNPSYVSPTIEEITEMLDSFTTSVGDRSFRIHTGPAGEAALQRAFQEELARQFPVTPEEAFGVSVRYGEVATHEGPILGAHNMTEEELINYLDQISQEDV